MTEDGALEHLDAIASKYVGRPIRYFGECIPARFAETEVPVLCRIRPTHVVAVDARPAEATDMTAPIGRPHLRRSGRADRPGGPPRPADASDLRRLHHDGPRRPAPLVPGLGRRGRRVRPREHDVPASERAQRASEPEVSLLVVDPDDTSRFIQIRGDAELVTDGAVEHLDTITRRYTRHEHFYGGVYPRARAARDAGHLPDPRPAHHARRHPRLTRGRRPRSVERGLP